MAMTSGFGTTRRDRSAAYVLDHPWSLQPSEVFAILDSTEEGLSTAEANRRVPPPVERLGFRRHSAFELLLRQFRSPLILLLLAAAAISMALAERIDSLIIVAIVVGSGLLGFVQERSAVRAIDALRELVTIHVDVSRDGRVVEVSAEDLVPGDVVHLDTGDVVPGDCIILDSNRLSVDESVLTGEVFPVHKEAGVVSAKTPLSRRSNFLFFGSHVASGSAKVLVVSVGRNTEFGSIERKVAQRHLPTSFERGVTAYGRLLIKATAVLVVGVFMLNVALQRSLSESVLFSLALAVGLAPQLLPAIVTLSLSIGARLLAAEKVIVKRLDAIEDFGSIDVLCTDKTGTLTEGSVHVEGAFDTSGLESKLVLERAFWNAHLQQGHRNPIDDAISDFVGHGVALPAAVAEIPFDFARKMVSVVVESHGERLLVCKGAVEQVVSRCSHAAVGSQLLPIGEMSARLNETFRDLSSQGLRVLGVAERAVSEVDVFSPESEDQLVFLGFLAFVDPAKASAREAIARLREGGVTVKIITGDNREISRMTAESVGLDGSAMLTGAEMEQMTDEDLAGVAERTILFVEVDPLQKERIIRALSSTGHTVGFVGDGVNDVAALHAADVGISVDTGVDVAKETADLILLDKNLAVIADGIQQGRRVFVNTLKYVYVTTSANFGNMVSLACATAFLPFLPMLPLQILLLNFLSDVPGMTIATDNVDPERLVKPQHWDIRRVRRFMIVFGLLSTSIDLATFAVLRLGFDTDAAELRTGWFLVSVFTELVAMLFLRTSRPALRSRPGPALGASSIVIVVVALLLVTTSAAEVFRFDVLETPMIGTLFGLVVLYAAMTELLKRRLRSLFA